MTSTVRDYLVAQIDQKLKSCKSFSDVADEQGRPLSDDEKHTIEKTLDEVKSLKLEVKSIDDDAEFRKAIADFNGPVVESHEEVPGAATIGEAFAKSEGLARVKSNGFRGDWSTGSIDLPWDGIKTTVTEAASAIVQPSVVPGIVPKLAWPTRVAELFAQGTTDSNSVRYLYEATNTNAAAGITETTTKPESAITFTSADTTVGKIATFLPVSDEMLEDVAQMSSFLNNRLATFVMRKEDSELLNGVGSGSVTGILQVSSPASIQTGSALSLDTNSVIDAIYQVMTLIQTGAFLDADGIVMNPTDWAAIRLMKDANNQYYGGGPFTGAYGGSGGIAGDSLWGLPVVSTTAIAAGTILVGAFKEGAQIFRRQGLTVEATNSHGTYFKENITAFRAETRLALVCYRPSAFYALTGANLLEGS